MLRAIEILGLPFLGCLTMIGILGYLGLHVLKREVIFIDIAVAQVAAVGVILAHRIWHVHGGSLAAYGCAFASTLVAAAFYALVRRRIVQIPLEAVIGVSYAIAAGGALFLIGTAPGGHVHVQHMLSGSILWTKWTDVIWCALVFSAVGACFYFLRRPFTEISDDYEAAVQAGRRVVWWDFLFYALLGIVITQALGLAGVLVVFSFLIIPATVSAIFSPHSGVRLLLTWACGAAATVMGLLFAYYLDFSVGPAVAMFLGLLLVLAGVHVYLPKLAMGAAAVLVAALAALLVFGEPPAVSIAASAGCNVCDPPRQEVVQHLHQEADPPSNEVADLAAKAGDAQSLKSLFKQAEGDPSTRSEIVCRTLKLDARVGAQLALEFLKQDPPLFFRQGVVESLDSVMGGSAGFDVTQPFADSVNREAAAKVIARYKLKAVRDGE